MSDARRNRDRRALILLFISGFLAIQIHWAFAALGIWIIILGQLEHRGVLDRWNATRVLGGILMIRTKRGQKALEKIAKPRRAWRIFGEISLLKKKSSSARENILTQNEFSVPPFPK